MESNYRSSSDRIVHEIDHARAQEYALLATLLSRSPDAQLISRLALLDGDASPIGVAHTALAEVAARTNEEDARREYLDLFIGLGRGLLLPYSSYYLTGTLYGRPLARLRETLRLLGIEKVGGPSEPEDHAAILCEIMANFIAGHLQLRPRLIVNSSNSISLPGSDASLSTLNTLTGLAFMLAWAR